MALQKKQYRSSENRSRGGVKGQFVDTSSVVTGKTKKDYSRQVRAHHGSSTDEVQETLSKEIARRKKFG